MATSIFKFHILRQQNSLQLLWPHLTCNAAFSCRRFSHYSVLLLPHHLHFLSLSLPLLHSSRLHPPPPRPLLRRRFPPLFSPMSSLTGADNPTPSSHKSVSDYNLMLIEFNFFSRSNFRDNFVFGRYETGEGDDKGEGAGGFL